MNNLIDIDFYGSFSFCNFDLKKKEKHSIKWLTISWNSLHKYTYYINVVVFTSNAVIS